MGGLEKRREVGFCVECGVSGYRIAAIMSPCQGLDTGSTPVTRSQEPKDPDSLGLLVFLGKWEEKDVSRCGRAQHPVCSATAPRRSAEDSPYPLS